MMCERQSRMYTTGFQVSNDFVSIIGFKDHWSNWPRLWCSSHYDLSTEEEVFRERLGAFWSAGNDS